VAIEKRVKIRALRHGADGQDVPQPLRWDGDLGDGARDADRVVDRRRDRGADAIDPGLACAFEAERVERTWRVFGQEHLERRHLAGRGEKIVGESDGEGLSLLVIDELLEQCASYSLR